METAVGTESRKWAKNICLVLVAVGSCRGLCLFIFSWGVGTFSACYRKPVLLTLSDKHSPSRQLFNDAIKLAVAYKQNSADFMDEVMRELEVRKALLTALLLSD